MGIMSIHTVGEIAAVLGVIGSVVGVVLCTASIRALRDIRAELRKHRQQP